MMGVSIGMFLIMYTNSKARFFFQFNSWLTVMFMEIMGRILEICKCFAEFIEKIIYAIYNLHIPCVG